jgi:hypothetical protein
MTIQRARHRLDASLQCSNRMIWNSSAESALAAGAEMKLTQMYEWNDWRRAVVAEIRTEFRDLFSSIEDDEIDWDAWRPLYLEGCPPRLAVDKAFVRYN